ncbi:uncharacterized protein LOC144823779 [Lissotriton helveticus]
MSEKRFAPSRAVCEIGILYSRVPVILSDAWQKKKNIFHNYFGGLSSTDLLTHSSHIATKSWLLELLHGTYDCASLKSKENKESSMSWALLAYVTVGAGIGAVAAPAALTAAGFTAAGITAGSLAAAMMKLTALAYGGGVPAGSVVAILQSVGATTGAAYVSAAVGGAAGFVLRMF